MDKGPSPAVRWPQLDDEARAAKAREDIIAKGEAEAQVN